MRTSFLLPAALVALVGLVGVSEAAVYSFDTVLSGPAEAPPNSSTGAGNATLTVDTDAQIYYLALSFSGLLGTTTSAHVHGATASPGTGTAIVMTETPFFGGFPIGVTSGSFSRLFDMTDPGTFNTQFIIANGGTVQGASAAFLTALSDGRTYLNIHTSQFPAGEIRGFFSRSTSPQVPAVPLPAGGVLWLSALALLGVAGIRTKKAA